MERGQGTDALGHNGLSITHSGKIGYPTSRTKLGAAGRGQARKASKGHGGFFSDCWESLCEVIGLLGIDGFRSGSNGLGSSSFFGSFSGSSATGSRSHSNCGIRDSGVGAGVSIIVVLWKLVLVIAYYGRRDYCIVSTVYIHFFTRFYAFFLHVTYSSSNSLRFLEFHYNFWSFTTIFGVPTEALM
jgi:hypothetical protein